MHFCTISQALYGGAASHFAGVGETSDAWWALVHQAVPISTARTIPKAWKSVLDEWYKLNDKLKVWDVDQVRPKAEVIAEAKKAGKVVHSGNLME